MSIATPVIVRPPLSDIRGYIYAADLFDALVDATGAQGATRMRLARISDEAVELRHDAPQPAAPDYCGQFETLVHGRPFSGWLRLVPGDVVRERSALLDAETIPGAQLGLDSATVSRRPDCSVARTALVLTVALLEELFPDDTWNLAEISAVLDAPGAERVAVRLARQMSRFLVVEVMADAACWGQFILAATRIEGGAG